MSNEITDNLIRLLKFMPEVSDSAYKYIKEEELKAFRSKDKKKINAWQEAWDIWENRNEPGGFWDQQE